MTILRFYPSLPHTSLVVTNTWSPALPPKSTKVPTVCTMSWNPLTTPASTPMTTLETTLVTTPKSTAGITALEKTAEIVGDILNSTPVSPQRTRNLGHHYPLTRTVRAHLRERGRRSSERGLELTVGRQRKSRRIKRWHELSWWSRPS